MLKATMSNQERLDGMGNPDVVTCPYCYQRAYYTSSKEIYNGRDYGPVWLCKCVKGWAYVGCHKGTNRPLGRLADPQLRAAKKGAHKVFDKLWKGGTFKRGQAYRWLAETLRLTPEECHIGMFDVDQCMKTIKVSKEKLYKLQEREVL